MSVVSVSRDEVYVADYSGLHRGSARTGFSRVIEEKLQHACLYQGELYSCAYSDGLAGALVRASCLELSVPRRSGPRAVANALTVL